MCGVADALTCRAEVVPGAAPPGGATTSAPPGTSAAQYQLSGESPLFTQKSELLRRVVDLVRVVERVSVAMEAKYPSIYHRGLLSRVRKTAGKVFKKMESMSVVFSR